MLDTTVKRINLRLPAYVQDYYKEMGEKYSVPYSNYIAMVLTQLYEQDMDKRLVSELNSSMKMLKDVIGDNPVQVMDDSKQLIDEIKSLAETLNK